MASTARGGAGTAVERCTLKGLPTRADFGVTGSAAAAGSVVRRVGWGALTNRSTCSLAAPAGPAWETTAKDGCSGAREKDGVRAAAGDSSRFLGGHKSEREQLAEEDGTFTEPSSELSDRVATSSVVIPAAPASSSRSPAAPCTLR